MAVALAAVLVLTLGACSDLRAADTVVRQPSFVPFKFEAPPAVVPYPARTAQIYNPSKTRGGTLRMALSGQWGPLDPAEIRAGYARNFARNYGRALTTFRAAPGSAGSELVPDLAESLGVPSDDLKTWTYRLRGGIKYEDGVLVTAEDVKYAIERSRDLGAFPNAPHTVNDYLDVRGYMAPYKSTTEAIPKIAAIETPDKNTIVFKLEAPFATFDHYAQTPATMPVPKSKDADRKSYGSHVVSTGPYKFQPTAAKDSFTLIRNPRYDPATDPESGRLALPAEIHVQMGVDPAQLDRRLLSGDVDVDARGSGVLPETRRALQSDPPSAVRSVTVDLAQTRYTVLNADVGPFENLSCRRAVLLAIDRSKYQSAYGGRDVADIATSLLPPLVPGAKKIDLYWAERTPAGELKTAQESLRQCGQPNGFTAKIAFREERPEERAAATALQASLARVGIVCSLHSFKDVEYYAQYAGNHAFATANGIGLLVSGWDADWPEGSNVLSEIVGSAAIRPVGGSTNLGVSVPAVDALLARTHTTASEAARRDIWGQIDERLMQDAVLIPGVWIKTILLRPPTLLNAFVSDAFGMFDYIALGSASR